MRSIPYMRKASPKPNFGSNSAKKLGPPLFSIITDSRSFRAGSVPLTRDAPGAASDFSGPNLRTMVPQILKSLSHH